MIPATRILVGEIGAAHGIRGEVKLISFTDNAAAIADYGALETEKGSEPVRITKLTVSGAGLIARIEGITNRSEAELLRGRKLYLPRERLPALEKGSYYHADLVGLEVKAEGRVLGKVSRVWNFGAGDLLEVEPQAKADTMFVPFAGARVDFEEETIEVELPEGFLDSL